MYRGIQFKWKAQYGVTGSLVYKFILVELTIFQIFVFSAPRLETLTQVWSPGSVAVLFFECHPPRLYVSPRLELISENKYQ